MPPRLHVNLPLAAGLELALPAGAARHVQVLRLQPGAALTLFNGAGGEWSARVLRMGARQEVDVAIEAHQPLSRELPLPVTLALGMPANERMDTLVEKAAELGAAALQPLITERSVLRLAGERAERRREHWQGVAIAACEQCGRTSVPAVAPVRPFAAWLDELPPGGTRWLLSLDADARALPAQPPAGALTVLSGPEGGLSPTEQQVARAAGFVPLSLGPRVLRADTAPLALLAWIALESR
jgi:16S rRNA (uracil1498-N3)-methyltransferase